VAYSGQERKGYQLGYDDAIWSRANDNPYNIQTVPASFRAYSEGFAEGSGSTTPPRGPAGPKGPTGDNGSQGVSGIGGADGSDGLSFLQGIGSPGSGLGKQGDTYLDIDSGDIFNKTSDTVWTLTGNANLSFAQQVDDTNVSPTNITYAGDATPGELTANAVWRIRQISQFADGDISVLWADGNSNFDNIWDDRLGLSYS